MSALSEDTKIISEQVAGLRTRGHKVELYCVTSSSTDEARLAMTRLQARRIFPLMPAARYVPPTLSVLAGALLTPASALRMRQADVLVGWDQVGTELAYLLSKLLQKPYLSYRSRVSGARSGSGSTSAGNGSQVEGRAARQIWSPHVVERLERESVGHATAVLAGGAHVAEWFRATYGREATICGAGCRPQSQRVLRLDAPQLFDGAFKLGDSIIEKPYLLVIGQDQQLHQLETAFQVLANVTQELPGAYLVIVGMPAVDQAAINRAARRQLVDDRFLVTGELNESDLQRLFREAAVFCQLEPERGGGLWALEAMSWGIPVVAWNQLTTRLIVENARTGFLAQTGSISAFASAVAWLLQDSDLRWRLGAAGWERAGKLFSWDSHLDLLERALTEAAADLNPNPGSNGSGAVRRSARFAKMTALVAKRNSERQVTNAPAPTATEGADPTALQGQDDSPLAKEIST